MKTKERKRRTDEGIRLYARVLEMLNDYTLEEIKKICKRHKDRRDSIAWFKAENRKRRRRS